MNDLLTVYKDFLLNGVFLKIGILGELSEGVKDVMLKKQTAEILLSLLLKIYKNWLAWLLTLSLTTEPHLPL
jgi:hypothetical protein